jgi:hypothetical protein
MTSFELEVFSREKEQSLLKQTEVIRLYKESQPKTKRIQRLALALSELLIWVGISLHNLYLPTVDETLMNYKSAL